MKVSNKDLIPFSLSHSILDQIKANPNKNSQIRSGIQLKSAASLLKDTVSISDSGTGAKTISMENIIEKRIYLEESSQVWAAVTQNVGADSKAYDALSDLGIAFPDEMDQEEWKDLAKAAVNAGEKVDVLLDAAAEHGRQGKSIDDLSQFLSFTADLSAEDLTDFLSAIEHDPGQAELMIDIANQLGDGLTGQYLKTASLNLDDLEDLNDELVRIMERDGKDTDLSSYFSLAAKAQDNGLVLLEAFDRMTESTQDRVSVFGNTRVAGQNLENFITFASFAGETAITKILNQSETLKDKNLQNMIKAASGAKGQMNGFLSALDRFSQKQSGTFSRFLSTAAKAEQALPAMLDNLEKIDVKFTATLSTVDTVNYLEAVDNAGNDTSRLNKVGDGLNGRDRSLLFYAIAQTKGDAGDLLDQVQALDGTERSEFLFQAANQENAGPSDEDIYMKGILSDDSFKDYQTTRANLKSWQPDSLEQAIENIDAQSRDAFLEASAAAGEAGQSFLTKFDVLSFKDQNTLLEISQNLGEEERAQFVKGAVKAGEDAHNFLALTQKIMNEDDSGQVVSDFLDAAEAASPSQIKDMVAFVGSLNKGQRKSFLSAVANTQYSLSQLLETGKKVRAASNQVQGVFNYISKGLITLEQAKTYYG
ncbi:hypothetical protein [Desulfobacter curvatus]|uniref:hypothetical protein n=1 Tax=Desulfobacter curvatus TaxID=2290 RepID=UPI00037A65F2|nr:hypothetical protein [Desulfobacter curvatus]